MQMNLNLNLDQNVSLSVPLVITQEEKYKHQYAYAKRPANAHLCPCGNRAYDWEAGWRCKTCKDREDKLGQNNGMKIHQAQGGCDE